MHCQSPQEDCYAIKLQTKNTVIAFHVNQYYNIIKPKGKIGKTENQNKKIQRNLKRFEILWMQKRVEHKQNNKSM